MREIYGVQRFIGLNTEDRLGMLRRAWAAAPVGANTLLQQLQIFAQQASDVEVDDVQSSASNSHSTSLQQPALATAAAAEKTRAWNQIIEGYQTVRQYLKQCCKYGLDAFDVQSDSAFPSPLPDAINPVDSRVIVDTGGKWELLCDKYEDEWVNSASVIGKVVDDGAIYLWLLNNPSLLNITKGVTEQRGDYTEAIVGRQGGLVYV